MKINEILMKYSNIATMHMLEYIKSNNYEKNIQEAKENILDNFHLNHNWLEKTKNQIENINEFVEKMPYLIMAIKNKFSFNETNKKFIASNIFLDENEKWMRKHFQNIFKNNDLNLFKEDISEYELYLFYLFFFLNKMEKKELLKLLNENDLNYEAIDNEDLFEKYNFIIPSFRYKEEIDVLVLNTILNWKNLIKNWKQRHTFFMVAIRLLKYKYKKSQYKFYILDHQKQFLEIAHKNKKIHINLDALRQLLLMEEKEFIETIDNELLQDKETNEIKIIRYFPYLEKTEYETKMQKIYESLFIKLKKDQNGESYFEFAEKDTIKYDFLPWKRFFIPLIWFNCNVLFKTGFQKALDLTKALKDEDDLPIAIDHLALMFKNKIKKHIILRNVIKSYVVTKDKKIVNRKFIKQIWFDKELKSDLELHKDLLTSKLFINILELFPKTITKPIWDEALLFYQEYLPQEISLMNKLKLNFYKKSINDYSRFIFHQKLSQFNNLETLKNFISEVMKQEDTKQNYKSYKRNYNNKSHNNETPTYIVEKQFEFDLNDFNEELFKEEN